MQLFAPILAVACLLSGAFAADSKKTAPPAAPAKSALDKAMIEAYVRHLFVWGAQIKVEIDDPKASQLPGFLDVGVHASAGNARQDEVFYVSKDGQKMVRGAVFDVAQNPFKADLEKLKTEFQPSFGTPGAPVVLVVFSDFQCPYCKDEAKMLRSNLPGAYPKQVRVYFKDLPLDQIHPWARPAAIAGRCVFKQNPGAFWDYHDWIFEHQAEVTADNLKSKVLEFAKGKEIDVLQLSRCLDTKATEAEVDKSVAESRALKVTGTPTLFVNGRRLPNQVGWPDLRAIIDFEIEYQKTAKNAGEDCGCEVKLPTPGLN
ncbi:MAG: DsbA family protein [Candidatus Solibacter usitatus]|nr:DsbA family protein [Candidatus Solibacter usitatus]